jgi:hypothetical protein
MRGISGGEFILICIGLLIYMLPAWVAYGRLHARRDIIMLINLLTGWTLIGWLGSLIWATSGERGDDIIACPYCAEKIKKQARVCRFCHRDLP